VKGTWVEGAPIETVFYGTVRPANGQALQLLPEGKRNSEAISVYAPIGLEFTAADPRIERSGDRIVWEEKVFEVEVLGKWKNGLLPHWEIICVREKEGEA
jgi:hypothetical protein